MTAKEYLKQTYYLRRQLVSIQYKLEELQAESVNVGAVRYDKDRVQTSPEDRLPAQIGELIELENKYQRMIAKYHKAVQQRITMIERLDDPIHVRLLTLRYCDGMSFEKVACEMHYTYRHTVRLHGQALAAFTKKYRARLSLQ